MTSKAHYAFTQKLSYFDDDIELIDVLKTAVTNGDLTDPNSNRVFRHVNQQRHRHLSRRRNADGSREIAINHLRSTIYSSYIKDLYEEVTEYLRAILEQASRNGFNSGQIVGEHNFKMNASTVLGLGGWDEVCRVVAESVFQSLESERSTLELVRKMARKLGLGVDQALIDDALPYLEVRHFLIHADGRLSEEFRNEYPHIPRKQNGCINLTYSFVTNARDKANALIAAFDAEVIANGLLAPEDIRQ
jgi:hypothetical protein